MEHLPRSCPWGGNLLSIFRICWTNILVLKKWKKKEEYRCPHKPTGVDKSRKEIDLRQSRPGENTAALTVASPASPRSPCQCSWGNHTADPEGGLPGAPWGHELPPRWWGCYTGKLHRGEGALSLLQRDLGSWDPPRDAPTGPVNNLT